MMDDEKKYMIFCWGTISLFLILLVLITLGGVIGFETIYNFIFQRDASQGFQNVDRNICIGIGIFLFLGMLISCGSALYIGNKPGPMIESKNH